MQISSNIHAIEIPFAVPTPLGNLERSVFVYLVCGERVTLIDSGVAGAEKAIFSYLATIGRKPEVDRLLLTHSHPDHVGAARAIRNATGCCVLAGAGERRWIEDTELQARERPVPGFASLVGGPVSLDRVVADGDVLDLGGGLSLEVLASPGHSAGSMSFYLREERALFCGDAVPVPGDLPIYDDFRTSQSSLERLGEIKEVALLLEAWQEPRRTGIAGRIAAGSSWLETVDQAVQQVAASVADVDAMALCRQVVTQLGLSPQAANPLVARSLSSHLRQK